MTTKRITVLYFAKVKAEIKETLDGVYNSEKARVALEMMEEHDSASVDFAVKTLVLIISALYHNLQYGGLTKQEIRSIEEQGMGLIGLMGKEDSPIVKQARAELGAVNCMVFQSEGRYWESLTMSKLVEIDGRNLFADSPGYPNLMWAIQLSRIGFSKQALKSIQSAKEKGLTQDNKFEAQALEIQLQRLSGDSDGALKLIAALLNADPPPYLSTEAQWQKLIIECQRTGTFWPMMNRTKAAGSFDQKNYVLETFLWMYIQKDHEYRKKNVRPKTLTRRGIKPKEHPALWRVMQLLHDCYSEVVPLRFILPRIGEVLQEIQSLPSFEHQLLTLGCFARFFASQRLFDLAAVVIKQYRHQSNESTEGKSDDVLNVLSDMYDRNWFAAA